MKKYLIDIHCHTSEVSNCGQTPAAETVQLYYSMGYKAVMITDHFKSNLLEDNPDASWDEKIDHFVTGYKNALAEAEKLGDFKVYLGAELRFDENNNDYLLFGLSEDKLRKMEKLPLMSVSEGVEFVHSLDCAIIQAHPFRNGCTIIEPGILDGVEVFNGHKGHDSRNDIALKWAKKFGYIMTSGTDFHGEHDPTSGIYVDNIPENEDELRDLILSGNYDIKHNGKLDL
ncbi:MAG: PHP domain-containing protein [Clostridia bacterium]|nr:PHP domain-containing protein [Clostridia bacterium]